MSISKTLTDLCEIRPKKNKKEKSTFPNVVYNTLVVKNVIEHIKTCLTINGKQNLKLKSSSIKFRNHFKQLAVPFKIYPDFECHIKRAKSNDKNNASCTENYEDHVPCRFGYKIVCIDDRYSKRTVLYRGKNAIYRLNS